MDDDERFSHIAKDPRFKKIPSKKRKIKIDARFRQMFTDEDFNTKYFVDKRGRKVKESAREDLSTFYKLSDEDEEENVGKPDEKIKSDNASEEVIPKKKAKEKSLSSRKRERKEERQPSEDESREEESLEDESLEEEALEDESLEDEQQPSEDEHEEQDATSDDEENDGSDVVENWHNPGANAAMTEEATKRLAVCNMDWDKIAADDLFVLFHSFLPSGGSIHSVKIYPSDYGLERMEREDEIGPTELVTSGNDGQDKNAEFNQERLRQYQLNRLRYYYAVLQCDSPATSEKIYEECDGMEYEASSAHLDLRFIPEDMSFYHEPTSQSTVLPSPDTYTPSEFITTALQQSTVRLTWDETDPKRVQTTMRSFSKDDLLDMDFKAYLASSSSEGEESDQEENTNQDEKIAKYKALLEEIHKKDNESENEMEVTWEVGLRETTEEIVKRKKSEKEDKKLTPWESYLNEKKEKKKKRKKLKENNNESDDKTAQLSDDDELPADVDLNDPFFAEELKGPNMKEKKSSSEKKRKRKGGMEESEEDKRRKAELQLLMMDEDDDKKHFNLKSIMKNEKTKKRKKKKKLQEDEKDEFKIDVNDSRFSALYSSHHYAVDPSDHQFKKTKAMDSIIEEKQRRSGKEQDGDMMATVAMEISDKKKKGDLGLSALVKNVKSNAVRYRDKKEKISRKK